MKTLNEYIDVIHKNAVAHGFWGEAKDGTPMDDGRPAGESFALIHDEWSEALEEYRSNRPMVWYPLNEDCGIRCGEDPSGTRCECRNGCPEQHKPEGIAVELIDGVIRILDYCGHCFGAYGFQHTADNITELLTHEQKEYIRSASLPEMVNELHVCTVEAFYACRSGSELEMRRKLMNIVAEAFFYVKLNGCEPLELMEEKMNYNKNRPYRHGKKC